MSKADALREKFGKNLAQTVERRPGMAPTPDAGQGPDRYAGAVKSRAFADLPVDAIVRDESQPREEFDEEAMGHLAESIRRHGQLSPIRVRRDEGRGAWVVLVGERRWRACKMAGMATVRVEFVEREMSDADILAEQTIENMVRRDLKPVEQAKAYRRLMDLNGWTVRETASHLSVAASGVARALGLLRLPDDVAGRVDAGEIGATAAYEIAQLDTAEAQRSVADAAVAHDLDHNQIVDVVKAIKAKRKPPAARPDPVTIDLGAVVVTVKWKKADPMTAAQALRRALKEAQERERAGESDAA